jgi:cytosine/creatinine deaminase
MSTPTNDAEGMRLAYEQAKKSFDEGGVPVGAALTHKGSLLAVGHNRRVQGGDPIAHGEMDCLRKAGRRRNYKDCVLYTTLSPCMMCAGTIVQFGIKKVVVGEAETFPGNLAFLSDHGVEVMLMNDERCRSLMREFIRTKPELWFEDIAED